MIEALLSLPMAYALVGILLLAMAWRTAQEGRLGSAAFWAILGLLFAWGSVLPYRVSGVLVVALVVLDGLGLVRPGRPLEPGKEPHQRALWPVLAIPLVTFGAALAFQQLGWDSSRGAVVGLALGSLAGMGLALALFRARPLLLLDDGRRLNDAMGAVSILPQLLASLGVLLTAAGLGQAIAHLFPGHGHWAWLALLCCLSMSLLTVLLGNSFAAFPVIATGLFFPLLIVPYGLDPCLAIILLSAGSTGTLMTPMAANFNLIPAALLEMKDPYGVIRFQLPFALAMGLAHGLLMILLIAFSPGALPALP